SLKTMVLEKLIATFGSNDCPELDRGYNNDTAVAYIDSLRRKLNPVQAGKNYDYNALPNKKLGFLN
ncbi:hypothetical protein ABTE23_22195, partial [Acinetobacter baumannii]